jgi:hypothetical protein
LFHQFIVAPGDQLAVLHRLRHCIGRSNIKRVPRRWTVLFISDSPFNRATIVDAFWYGFTHCSRHPASAQAQRHSRHGFVAGAGITSGLFQNSSSFETSRVRYFVGQPCSERLFIKLRDESSLNVLVLLNP